MSKSLIILLSVLAFSSVISAQNSTNATADQINMKYYAACARGALQGFEQSFYNNASFKIADQCLGTNQINQAYKLYQAYMSGAILNIFQTISTTYQLMFMLQQTCNTEQIFYDMSTWCMNADCSVQTIINNVVKKFFQITGSLNNLAEAMAADSPAITNTTAYFNKYATAGSSVGKITRIIFDFQWKVNHIPTSMVPLFDWLNFNLLILNLKSCY